MGEMLGNKRQDRGKKNSGGQKLLGGRLFGEMPKKGWKNFLAVPKSGGNFFGGHNNFIGGEFFRKNLKKKNPRRGFSAKLSQKNLGGIFRGGRIQGDVCGGMLGNKRQDRGEKNFRGPEIWGGNFWGKCKKRGGRTFGGSVGGPVNPNKF